MANLFVVLVEMFIDQEASRARLAGPVTRQDFDSLPVSVPGI